MMNPVTPQQSDPIIGQMVGTYRVEAEIGRGGMGVVYLAKEITLGVSAALKVLSPRWATDPKRCDEFLEEAKTLARVRPNDFVKVRSFETLRDGSPAFLMEFIDGRSLASMLADSPGTPLSVSQALGIARRVASAMAAAHAAGIIHRDLKPSNIMVVGSSNPGAETIKIIDFGISVRTGETSSVSHCRGTPAYMAPENRYSGAITSKVDVYSLGCMLFEMLSGNRMFPYAGTESLPDQHAVTTPRPIREQNTSVPEPVDRLLAKMLAKEPEDRPDMATVAGTLEAFVESPLVTAAQRPRFSVRWSLLAGFMLVSAGVLFWRVLNPVSHPMIRLAAAHILVGSTAEELEWLLDTLALRSPREFALYKTHALLVRETPVQRVAMKAFFIDKYEVSCLDFGTWLDRKIATGSIAVRTQQANDGSMFEEVLYRNIPMYSLSPQRKVPCIRYADGHFTVEPSLANYPVSAVSWNAAEQYCEGVGKRLPTQQEWEYAARGTKRRMFPWGSSLPICAKALLARGDRWNDCVSLGHGPGPIGSVKADCTEEGVCDLGGSVQEWTSSEFLDASSREQDTASGQPRFVVKGGSWSLNLFSARGAGRERHHRDDMDSFVGFRCVKSID